MLRLGIALAAAIVALALAGTAATKPTTLAGTVGPGFTITLTKGGKKVTKLKTGMYTFAVSDRSDSHNFHLRGPGVDKEITTVGFEGRKTVTVRLKRGRYTYVCDPHASAMRGSFRVS